MASAAPAPAGSVDFGRSFTLPTEDPDWLKKILIGGAFALACAVLVGVPFVLGYFSRTLRSVVAGASTPMPEWSDLGGLFEEGLRLTAVYLVYTLGIAAVIASFGCILLAPLFVLSGGQRPSDVVAALGGLGILAFYAVIAVVSLVVAIYLPAALARTALRGSVREGFAWREILGFIQSNLANYLIALVIYLLAAFLAQFGMLVCCVGFFPATFWGYMVFAVALGQAVRFSPTPV
jgi:hypothetical protein